MGYEPKLWMAIPFALLLAAIAVGPLWFAAWWSKHYPQVAVSLALLTLAFYLGVLRQPEPVWHAAHEYACFIALIGSLFVVSGGIHITVKGEATPLNNVVFLLAGALVANLLGTTGASMLLIRPWLRMNKYRLTAHHVVFFIFIVSNVGGCLTPVGDPPLFLGYLRGVPFWWVAQHCWPMWAVGVGLLLAIFYALDRRNYLRAPPWVRAHLAEPPDRWRFEGLGNLFFLGLILGSVFLQRPPFLREALLLGAAVGSWCTTPRAVHAANHFNFHPIREVAILFLGIFATMLPALDWLQRNAGTLGVPTPGMFYWATGGLSSVLDNAPTYLSFLSAAMGALVQPEVIQQVHQLVQQGSEAAAATGPQAEQVRAALAALKLCHPDLLAARTLSPEQIQIACLLGSLQLNEYLVAVSVGAVFFGACTYIGNGPNFLVKSIADQQKAHAPGFLGYVFKYTFPYLLPVLGLIWWFFFRQK